MKKIKTRAPAIRDRAELETAMGGYAKEVIETDRLTVEMEERIRVIRAEYEPRIAACCEAGDALFEALHAWADTHPEEFGGKKSLELLHGTLGFRTCPPAVRLVKGVRVQDAIDRINDFGPVDSGWIRMKEEIDKERILADVSAGTVEAPALKRYGLYVDQGETFYTDVKREGGE